MLRSAARRSLLAGWHLIEGGWVRGTLLLTNHFRFLLSNTPTQMLSMISFRQGPVMSHPGGIQCQVMWSIDEWLLVLVDRPDRLTKQSRVNDDKPGPGRGTLLLTNHFSFLLSNTPTQMLSMISFRHGTVIMSHNVASNA